jgi:hypothetical protein
LLTGKFLRNRMGAELLQAGLDDLRQVAALVLFGDADGFFDFSFPQATAGANSRDCFRAWV